MPPSYSDYEDSESDGIESDQQEPQRPKDLVERDAAPPDEVRQSCVKGDDQACA